MKCDVIALGLIAAIRETGIKIPLVVRLQGMTKLFYSIRLESPKLSLKLGTNVEAARKIMEESGLR